MHPYLHILIRVQDDGSLHALGAFTTKERQTAYQQAAGLTNSQVRFDFYNGPFEDESTVIYAGHRRWNMDRFQLAGYFNSEGEAWTWVTQEGYVSVLQIDITYEDEKALEAEALQRYAKHQKCWRLSSYQALVTREGMEKARANIILRYHEDALESFKPNSRRDIRALYALFCTILGLPLAILYFLKSTPEYGEHLPQVNWLPDYASDISYYHSEQVQVYEFKISPADFKRWAQSSNMTVQELSRQEILSRYNAYLPSVRKNKLHNPSTSSESTLAEDFEAWQDTISITIKEGLTAYNPKDNKATVVYDTTTERAYFEHLLHF
jgi:hypothetical protein